MRKGIRGKQLLARARVSVRGVRATRRLCKGRKGKRSAAEAEAWLHRCLVSRHVPGVATGVLRSGRPAPFPGPTQGRYSGKVTKDDALICVADVPTSGALLPQAAATRAYSSGVSTVRWRS